MDVALWEDFIDKFDVPALIARSASSPVAIACNSLQLREYKGRWSLKTFVGTQFHFDEDIPEIASFCLRLPPNLPPIFRDVVVAAQCMQQFNILTLPRLQPKKVTLLELANVETPSDLDIFECIGEITDVITRFDWYYESCPNCNRKIYDPDRRPYCDYSKCVSYKTRVMSVPWYRFTVQVRDETAVSRFVLLGNQGETVVGARPGPLIAEQKLSPDDAPATLLAIIGKKFLFGISGREVASYHRYHSYTVQSVGPVPGEELPLLMAAPADPSNPADTASAAGGSEPPSGTPADAILGQHSSYSERKAVVDGSAVVAALAGKRLIGDSSDAHTVPIRNIKRRLDFSGPDETSGQDEAHVACDIVAPPGSSPTQVVP